MRLTKCPPMGQMLEDGSITNDEERRKFKINPCRYLLKSDCDVLKSSGAVDWVWCTAKMAIYANYEGFLL